MKLGLNNILFKYIDDIIYIQKVICKKRIWSIGMKLDEICFFCGYLFHICIATVSI